MNPRETLKARASGRRGAGRVEMHVGPGVCADHKNEMCLPGEQGREVSTLPYDRRPRIFVDEKTEALGS